MRVLVATSHLQQSRPGDDSHTVDGELVLVETEECADADHCGCARVWRGIASRRATTTAMVVDLPHLTEADLYQAVADRLDASGWSDALRRTAEDAAASRNPPIDDEAGDGGHVELVPGVDDVEDLIDGIVVEHVELIAEVCSSFPVGTVVERQGSVVRARTSAAAA